MKWGPESGTSLALGTYISKCASCLHVTYVGIFIHFQQALTS
jgi:hypothetical protein